MPDFDIIEINTKNFDIDCNLYTKEAYSKKRYAFVADFARLFTLYNYGGVYLDLDVELLKKPNKFLNAPAFSGYEDGRYIGPHILGSEQKGKWLEELLKAYEDRHFIVKGKQDLTPMPRLITEIMVKKGLKQDNSFQTFNGLVEIYPKDYFSPKDYNKKITLTENTFCIHHFAKSWWTKTDELKSRIFNCCQKLSLM